MYTTCVWSAFYKYKMVRNAWPCQFSPFFQSQQLVNEVDSVIGLLRRNKEHLTGGGAGGGLEGEPPPLVEPNS